MKNRVSNWFSNCRKCFKEADKNDRKSVILDQIFFNFSTEESIALFKEIDNEFRSTLRQRQNRAKEESQSVDNFFNKKD